MTTIERSAEEELVGRVQELTAQVEAFDDPRARASAEELAAAVVQLYGEGLERIFATLQNGGLPSAFVRRDGREAMVPAHELVPGDILLLRTGHTIAADARRQHHGHARHHL